MSQAPTAAEGRSTRFLALHTGLGMVSVRLSVFLSALVIARGWGAEGQGRFQLFIAVGTLSVVISKLGLDEATAYLVARYRVESPQILRAIALYVMSRSLAISVLLGTAIFVLAPWLNEHWFTLEDFSADLRWQVLFIPALMLLLITGALLRGLGRADLRAITLYHIAGGGFFVLVAVVSSFDTELYTLYGTRVAVLLSAAVLACFWISRLTRVMDGAKLTAPVRREVWSFSGLMVFVAVAEYIVTQPLIDLIAVGAIADAAAVGVYAVASKVGSLVVIATSAMTVVMGPALAAAQAARNVESLRRGYEQASESMAFFTLFIAGNLGLAAPQILSLFGPEFSSGLEILLVFLGARTLMGLMGPNSALLLGTGHVRLQFILTGAGSLAFIAAVAVAAHAGSILWIAAATGASMLLVEISRFVAVRRLFAFGPSRRSVRCVIPLLPALGLGLGCLMLPLPPLLSVTVAVATFSGSFCLLAPVFGAPIPLRFRDFRPKN